MKIYQKPELLIESIVSKTTVAADPFDFTGGAGNEVEVSATDWWNLLG